MTRREKILATTLVFLLVFGGGGFLCYAFVYTPINDLRTRVGTAETTLAKKQAELTKEKEQIDQLLRLNPRLAQWPKLTLPPTTPDIKKLAATPDEQKRKHLANLKNDYSQYLSALMRANGLQSVEVSTKPPDGQTPRLQAAKGKEPLYERLAFSVKGKGSKETMVKVLREFHKAPILHQMRSLTMTMANPTPGGGAGRRGPGGGDGTLDVNMTVEALVVQGGESRAGLMPEQIAYPPKVLADPGRDYLSLGKKNVFTGIPPTPTERARQSESRADVLKFVKLTTIYFNPDRRRWEASIYDQAAGPTRTQEETEDGGTRTKVVWEKQINTRILNQLAFYDRYRNPVLEGKVVHIDEGQVVFSADKKFYRLRCGDAFYPAVEKPLSDDEVKELGLAVEAEEE